MRGTAVCGCPARHATACDARCRPSIGPNVGLNKHAQRRRGSIASPQALSLGHVELRLRTMATPGGESCWRRPVRGNPCRDRRPVASLAGVGLFAETHVGMVARQIAVVPISDAGPALASVTVIFEAVREVLDLKRDASARASVLAAPSRSSPPPPRPSWSTRWPVKSSARPASSTPIGSIEPISSRWLNGHRRPGGRRNSGQGRDRDDHGAQLARRALDPRRAVFAPRPSARR